MQGREFSCPSCSKAIRKLRRCDEDRWDFDHTDGNIWPMRIHDGGGLYSFCPGKATRDPEAIYLFQIITVSAETGSLYNGGGISDQPQWFIDLLSWFLPLYDMVKFQSKVRGVLGDGQQGKPNSQNQRRGKASRTSGR